MFQLPSQAPRLVAFVWASLLGASLSLGACGGDYDGIVPDIPRGGSSARGGGTASGGEPSIAGRNADGGGAGGLSGDEPPDSEGNAGAGGSPVTPDP